MRASGDARMSKSKIAVGGYRVAHEFGTSTTPLKRPSIGISEAVSGIEVVVHLASAPYRGRYTVRVDVDGTGRLLTAASQAGVRHLLFISIVGVDRVPWGYFRRKLAAEQVVRDGGAPWSVLRVTQFHSFLDGALRAASRLPALIGDAGIVAQPVDPRDVADAIVARVAAGPA